MCSAVLCPGPHLLPSLVLFLKPHICMMALSGDLSPLLARSSLVPVLAGSIFLSWVASYFCISL